MTEQKPIRLRDGAQDLTGKRHNRHGRAETSEYFTWTSMIQRWYNPKNRQFRHYGGRGIRVCERWRESFANFLADMGDRPPDLQLDRTDNDRHYSCGHCLECVANNWPANCRWATTTEQSRNRRSCRLLTLNGETMPLSAWAVRTGLPENTIRNRLRRGWSDERTLTEPVHWNPFLGPRPGSAHS